MMNSVTALSMIGHARARRNDERFTEHSKQRRKEETCACRPRVDGVAERFAEESVSRAISLSGGVLVLLGLVATFAAPIDKLSVP